MDDLCIIVSTGKILGPKGRQRTTVDRFWTDADLAGLDFQARYALLHALTSPSSNIIGVYRVVPRLICAELGWTQDEIQRVYLDLQRQEVITWDPTTGWIWVKVWWQHHHLGVAFGGKLSKPAIEEVRRMPREWLSAYLDDLRARGAEVSYTVSDTVSHTLSDTVSDTVPHTPAPNPIPIPILNPTPLSPLEFGAGEGEVIIGLDILDRFVKGLGDDVRILLNGIPTDRAQDLVDRLIGDIKEGSVKRPVDLLHHWIKQGAGWSQSRSGAAVSQLRIAEAARQRRLTAESPRDSSLEAIGEAMFKQARNRRDAKGEQHDQN